MPSNLKLTMCNRIDFFYPLLDISNLLTEWKIRNILRNLRGKWTNDIEVTSKRRKMFMLHCPTYVLSQVGIRISIIESVSRLQDF